MGCGWTGPFADTAVSEDALEQNSHATAFNIRDVPCQMNTISVPGQGFRTHCSAVVHHPKGGIEKVAIKPDKTMKTPRLAP